MENPVIIKYKYLQGEGYMVKVSDDSLDYCRLCGKKIENDEEFYICEKNKTAFCTEHKLSASCHSPNVSVIPGARQSKVLCVHRKIIKKEKMDNGK